MTHNTIDQLRQQQHQRLQRLELMRDSVVDLVSIWGPLLVPLVPAGLTFAAIAASFPALLGIPNWGAIIIALITATALEILGIVSVETWLSMKSYNQKCTDAGSRAPEHLALTVVIIYAATVATLVFLLKIFHSLALWSLLPLTALGLLTSWIVVLRKQHNERAHQQAMAEHEQNEIERLNALVEQLNEQHQAELNSLNVRHAAAIKQQAEQLNTEHQAVLNTQAEQLNTRHTTEKERLQGQIVRLHEQLQRSTERPEPARSNETPATEQSDDDPVSVRRTIVEHLIEHPNCTNQALADALGRSKSTISEHVKWLAEREIIDISKAGAKNILSVNGNAAAFMSGQML